MTEKGTRVRATQLFAEVRAYLDEPLPSVLAPSEVLEISMTSYPSDASSAVGYGWWDPEEEARSEESKAFSGSVRAPARAREEWPQ